MSKLWLVFQREYLVRVKKKSFIIATILVPIAFAALSIGAGLITALGGKSEKKILVKDDSEVFRASNTERDNMVFEFSDEPLDSLAANYDASGFDLLIHIPEFNDLSKRDIDVTYYSEQRTGIVELERVEDVIADAFREYKIDNSNIDRSVYESFYTNVKLESTSDKDSGRATSGKIAAIIGTVLGFVMGILMYMVILIYGQMVMRSVMEEKISRIAEVMISSVRPFELMMGKIIGVAAVGLTQLAIWMVLIPVIMVIVPLFVPGMDPAAMSGMAGNESTEAVQQAMSEGNTQIAAVFNEFWGLNWAMIIPSFIIFFLGGYFIYSSMFAAIGSAVDEDLGEAQQFMLPAMIPVILAFVIMMSTIENPNSSLAVFGSIFPLFSPIIMPARLPFDPPMWQVLLSIVLLIGTTLLFVWLSSRIYRVGILLYGKKVTFKELGRWMFRRV